MQQTSSFLKQLGVTRQEQTLKNGLRVVLYERPNMPVSIRAAFRSGARYDDKNKDGLAHFVEHMVVAGTKSYPSKDLLAQFIESYGGLFGATTGQDLLNINIHIAEGEDLEKAAHLLNEMLNFSLFDEKVFEAERGSVLRELGDKLSSPSYSLWDTYYPLFFEGSSMGRSVLGDEKTIQSITLDDIKRFFSTKFTVSRLTLIVSGGTTSAEVASAFENINLNNEIGVEPHSKAIPLVRKNPVHIRNFTINDQIDFLIGFRTCGHASEDRFGLEIIETILGGGRAATLTRKLRYEKGYIYAGYAESAAVNDTDGTWTFKTACDKKDLQATLDIICEEFQRVYTGQLTQKELSFAKNKLIKSLKMNMQASWDWVGFHTSAEVYTSRKTVDDYIKSIQSLTLDDISVVGKKYFRPGSWFLALAGSVKEEDFQINF